MARLLVVIRRSEHGHLSGHRTVPAGMATPCSRWGLGTVDEPGPKRCLHIGNLARSADLETVRCEVILSHKSQAYERTTVINRQHQRCELPRVAAALSMPGTETSRALLYCMWPVVWAHQTRSRHTFYMYDGHTGDREKTIILPAVTWYWYQPV